MTDTTLVLRRVLKAPRPLVWRCWTEPALLMDWYCPRPHRLTDVKVDLRRGGQWYIKMNVDGATPEYDGCLLDVDPGRRLVFTDLMVAGWRPVERPFLGYTAEIVLADHPEGTLYTATARHRTPQSAQRHDKMGFTEGWGVCADQLQELAGAMPPPGGPEELVLTRLLRADAETVWKAWDDPAVLPHWFGPSGHSCRTHSIDLTEGGAWVFDMIGPDGTIYPNRHRFTLRRRPERIEFIMDDGKGNMAKTAVMQLTPEHGFTRITMSLRFATLAERQAALQFGAWELGLTTLAKLARVVET